MVELTERLHLPYTASQLFELVADVGRYPEFVPWIIGAHVYQRGEQKVWADIVAGSGPLRRHFSTVATLERPHRIRVSSYDRVFERFEQRWTFVPAADGGTDLEYYVDLSCRSPVLRFVLARSFASRARIMVSAFVGRAHALYGRGMAKRPRPGAPISRP